jgi:hypothetical protein
MEVRELRRKFLIERGAKGSHRPLYLTKGPEVSTEILEVKMQKPV